MPRLSPSASRRDWPSEETEPGGGAWLGFAIQVHAHANVGLPRAAPYGRFARPVHECVGDCCPRFCARRTELETLNAEIASEFDVEVTIANHR
jgi:hypothetical protein